MAENSDYENEKKADEITQGFVLVAYLFIWPLGWFFWRFELLPTWFSVAFFLLVPYLIGSSIAKWTIRNQKPK